MDVAKKAAIKRLRKRGLANEAKARQQENKTSFDAMKQNSGPVSFHRGSYKPKGKGR